MRHLTIGILNINRPDLTIAELETLTALDSAVWSVQLILVDNGSDADKHQQVVDWFQENHYHFAETILMSAFRNLGADGGRNKILEVATGDAILFIDNDLILPEDFAWLDTLWQDLEDDPQVGIVGPMLTFGEYPHIVQATGIALTEKGRVGYINRGEPVSAIAPERTEVVASPAACWLIRRTAQQELGLLPTDYYPAQYEDVDYCMQMLQAGWKIVCDARVHVPHIENVTTRNLKDHPFARMTVKNGMQFRKKWGHILPQFAAITDDEIYWSPIPKVSAQG